MMNDILSETELAELICTRISHDVIGNVGAVSNAVELLEEGDMDFLDDIRSILKVSSSVLSARLKFFRLAFGLSNANLEDFRQVKSAAENYLKTLGSRNYPLSLELELHSAAFARQALVGIMIAADMLIKGGKIEAREVGGRLAVITHCETPPSAEKIRNIKTVLSGGRPENMAQYAPVFYLKSLMTSQKQVIRLIETPAFGLMMEQGE